MRYLSAFSLAVVLALLMPAIGRAQVTLGGSWSGDYSCAGVSGGKLTIELTDQQNGMVDGTLAFEVQGQSGSYHVAGRMLADGRFTLVPREWIERPAGFTALGAEGQLNPNGRLIEGRLNPCGMGQFSASRAALVTAGAGPPAPPSGGPVDGLWQGGIQCRQNRRGKTETYPLRLTIRSDTGWAGALAEATIYRKMGSNGGPSDTQVSILSGTSDGRGLALTRNLPLQQLRNGTNLREMHLELQGDGRLTGTTRLSGCDAVELQRGGAPGPVAVPPEMAGDWIMPTGVDAKTDVRLHVSASGEVFAVLNARYPLDQPEAARDLLHLVLAPMIAGEEVVVWAPVGYRQATGIFAPGAGRSHHFGRALAFTTALMPDGTLVFEAPAQGKALDLALADPARAPIPNDPRIILSRPVPGAEPQAGTTPPVRFAPTIGGTLAAAPTREAQCRIIRDWLDPETDPTDYERKALDEVMRAVAPAFQDDRFQPVFGLPYLLTAQEERTELARFIHDACSRDRDMRMIGMIGDRVFRSEIGFTAFAATLANTAETKGWSGELGAELAGLAPDSAALDRISALRREMQTRRADLTQDEYRDLNATLDRREVELRAGIFHAEAKALPSSGFREGALDRVLNLMDRMAKAELPSELLGPAREVAGERANAILDTPIAEAAALAPTLPSSLEGLATGQEALSEFTRYRPAMDAHFGSLDGTGRLRALYARLEELRRDPGVVSAFAALLEATEPAPAVTPSDRVWQVAGRYIGKDDLSSAPEMSDLIFRAIDMVEIRAIEIVDNSVPVSDQEPSAEDIARFALQRVRSYNEGMAAQEEACLSGQISDPIQAIVCLQTPAVWTGQTGFGAQLLRLEKFGCREDQPGVQYTCDFSQKIDIHMPGGDAFGASSLGQMARGMSEMEAARTRFVRNATGGWTGITEIEN